MKFPIDIQIIDQKIECPFYCKDQSGNYGCLVKEIGHSELWTNIFKDVDKSNFENDFKINCEGSFEKCCFANHFWKDQVENLNVEKNDKNSDEEEIVDIKISVHKVANPYLVKSDVLIYPANNLLEIDDPLLNRITANEVQKECDAYKTNVTMGGVYITGNGSSINRGVSAKKIYHAVVAGESRLVNISDIKKSFMKALMLADDGNNEIVTMMPADCGTHDITEVAFAQIETIKEFLTHVGVNSIKYIFIIMDDEESYDIFSDIFSRVFQDD